MRDQALIDVFSYEDYQSLLRDYYSEAKKKRRLSYRGFSKRAGLGAPNYLKLVMEGARKLTEAMAVRFAMAMQLSEAEQEYFVALVAFGQAENEEDKSEASKKCTALRSLRKAQRLDYAHSKYSSRWYLPAIREMVGRKDFREDVNWIARKLTPSITPKEAKEAIHLLIEIGLLERDESRRLRQGQRVLSTGPEAEDVLVANYHRMMILQGANAIETIETTKRDISTVTLCMNAGGIKRLKKLMQQFRKELLELSLSESDPVQVVQINLQLFPLTDE